MAWLQHQRGGASRLAGHRGNPLPRAPQGRTAVPPVPASGRPWLDTVSARAAAFALKGNLSRLRGRLTALVRRGGAPASHGLIGQVFDPAWYVDAYPEVRTCGLDPFAHYLKHGLHRGHQPTVLFDVDWYCQAYPEADEASLPLFDFLEHAERRRPNFLFDPAWYAAEHGLDDRQRSNPLGHYLSASRAGPLRTSPLFEADWYAATVPDLAASGLDPLSHYLAVGLPAGRPPNRLFDGSWYAERYDVEGGPPAALRDYMTAGHDLRRSPHALFDAEWYLSTYPAAAGSGTNPLAHYLGAGAREGLRPHPLFDPDHYRAQGGAHPPAHENPLLDYLIDERNWAKSTHPLFQGGWYQRQNPDVVAHRIAPLQHFVQSGAREGRSPCPLFATRWYQDTYPEAVPSGRNALVDYLQEGAHRGRDPNPAFDGAWYLLRNRDVAAAGVNPLVHYATAGWRERRDPSPDFDAAWYQARHPETDASEVDPLAHYLSAGAAAGYLTRPADRATPDCGALDLPFEILRAPASLRGRDACLFVTYAPDGRVGDHVVTLLRALKREGLAIVLVLVTEGLDHPLSADLDLAEGVLARVNHGWDFAAWATALAVFPDAWSATLLILANDSVYGPTGRAGLAHVLDVARASDKDVVALTDSHQVRRHLMSYFTVLTASGLGNPAVRAFWSGVRSHRDKATVINEYEIRSIERWEEAGVTYDVVFPAAPADGPPRNPTLAGWRDLVERGFPFVKVQVLRDFADTIDTAGWERAFAANRALVPQVRRHLGACRTGRPVAARPVPAPKQRYVQPEDLTTYYGATTACRPAEAVDLALEVPFRPVGTAALALPDAVAVVAHVFYPEFCPDLLDAVGRIPVRADVFVSTDAEHKRLAILDAFRRHGHGTVEVRVFPNAGRDIAPLVVGFRDVFARYGVFLHVHSKRSPHDDALRDWRGFLLSNLAGSEAAVRSILHLLTAHDVGLVVSQHLPQVRDILNFGHNFEAMRGLLKRCGAALTKDLVLDFPSGSFFWGRSDALAPLLALDLDWSDFPLETGQVDGTLAHAIERSLLYVAEAAGFRWAKVADARLVRADTLVPVQGPDDVEAALARAHRPLLRNRIPAPKQARLVPEVTPILTRRDRNPRPRLTLLIPTLQPAKLFGGVATALRVFEEIGAGLGPDADLRIVSLNDPVDMACMLGVPDYRLLSIAGVADGFGRTVLDASEGQRGAIPVRPNDVFVATAWWTAASAFAMQDDQRAFHGRHQPVVYLIQDHEPNFYNWSHRHDAARQTYGRPADTIAIVNSEELANYMGERYPMGDAYVLPFALNPAIRAAVTPVPRERIILAYGRPSVDRNCFHLMCGALGRWQCADPVEAARWRIVSAGEAFDPASVSHVRNLTVHGKLPLDAYGALLSRASVGLSLMASPHPSYPPLEMAYAGLRTVTNAFPGKDLSARAAAIASVPHLDAEAIAAALGRAVREAGPAIGTVVPPAPLGSVACPIPAYDPAVLARRLREGWA